MSGPAPVVPTTDIAPASGVTPSPDDALSPDVVPAPDVTLSPDVVPASDVAPASGVTLSPDVVPAPDVIRAPDVVCLGESMVAFLPSRPGRLADVPSFARAVGGAESNVACALAAAGHRVRWVGRVGRDGFGDHLVDTIAAHGVDVTAVGRDPHRPTGVYFRTDEDRATDAHEVVYYRAGSAASAMSPATVLYASVAGARILHLTGITAALSADCSLCCGTHGPAPRAPAGVLRREPPAGAVARRPRPGVLLELARRADVVFVGADEAERLWGVGDPDAIRGVLPEPGRWW
ncbi:PfkB family carbohydrate kinase [Streptomyces diastatochromogenes]|nr:PfkB family carbohydrate kinase [Streptomyces diastatochromogenes]